MTNLLKIIIMNLFNIIQNQVTKYQDYSKHTLSIYQY